MKAVAAGCGLVVAAVVGWTAVCWARLPRIGGGTFHESWWEQRQSHPCTKSFPLNADVVNLNARRN